MASQTGTIPHRQTGNWIVRLMIYLFLIGSAVICLIPFYSMFITATHTNSSIARQLLLIPGGELLHNYSRLVEAVPIWRGFFNTTLISTISTLLTVYFSALAGYGFSKYRFRLNSVLFGIVLGTMMIPGQLGIIGFYRLMDSFGWLNTYWPLILPSIHNAFGVFLMKQFADSMIPSEMVESGRMDGSGEWRIFHRLVLPLLMPGMATLAIFTFIGKWNDFLNPLIILFDTQLQTLPVMIAGVKSQFSADFGAQYVGIIISIIPILIVFSIMSRRIIGSVAAGAVKG